MSELTFVRPLSATTFVFPALVIPPGIIGIFRAFRIRSRRPEIYKQIGDNAP